MKYSFEYKGAEKTVTIDDQWLETNCRNLNISMQEAIEMWLSDEGYVVNEVVEALTAQAKANNIKNRGESTKERKKPTRTPDETKREIVRGIEEWVNGLSIDGRTPKDVKITNLERMVAFSLGGDNYEITLIKKRKPKI